MKTSLERGLPGALTSVSSGYLSWMQNANRPQTDFIVDSIESTTTPGNFEGCRMVLIDQADSAIMSVSSIDGIGPATEEKLTAAGIRSIDQLANADAAALAEETGLAEDQLEDFIARANEADSPSDLIDEHITELPDWQSKALSTFRSLIHEADPDVIEEVKWRKPSNPKGVPVWSHDGTICTGETYQDKVKLTFANGASLDDPAGLFNASLDGNERRAIDIHERDDIDEEGFKSLVRAAVAHNTS